MKKRAAQLSGGTGVRTISPLSGGTTLQGMTAAVNVSGGTLEAFQAKAKELQADPEVVRKAQEALNKLVLAEGQVFTKPPVRTARTGASSIRATS